MQLNWKNQKIIFSGYLAHTREYVSEVLKVLLKTLQKTAKNIVVYGTQKQIGAIYYLDNQLSNLESDDRKKQRQITEKHLFVFPKGKH